jgi:cytochrome c biogenesis protein CcmG, thiol:disulfide interchange protein DsbE
MMLRACVFPAALLISSAVDALSIGDALPNVRLPDAKNAVQALQRDKRITVVDFWASWCGPCRQSFGFWNRMHAKFGARIDIVAINVDENRADADRFLKRYPAQFQLRFDASGKSAEQFEVKVMPSSFIIDSDGKVRMIHQGFRAKDEAALEKFLQKCSSSEAIAPNKCSSSEAIAPNNSESP